MGGGENVGLGQGVVAVVAVAAAAGAGPLLQLLQQQQQQLPARGQGAGAPRPQPSVNQPKVVNGGPLTPCTRPFRVRCKLVVAAVVGVGTPTTAATTPKKNNIFFS